MAASKKRRRRIAGPAARRWFAVAALALVALLYYRPLHDYLQARSQRSVRVSAVRKLQKQQASLERRLHRAWSLPILVREARALGYIRPGEHLFIVKDIPQWKRGQHASRGSRRRSH
jgi:cell division protein FtsB